MPGISRFYRGLSVKPATFLQLLWDFQAAQDGCKNTARSAQAAPKSRRG